MKDKKGVLFGALGVLAGGVIAIGLQTHAAQIQNPASLLAPQVQQATTVVANGSDSTGVSDSKDSPETGTSVEAPEKHGSEIDGPGGHTDPNGANIDHQFQGVE